MELCKICKYMSRPTENRNGTFPSLFQNDKFTTTKRCKICFEIFAVISTFVTVEVRFANKLCIWNYFQKLYLILLLCFVCEALEKLFFLKQAKSSHGYQVHILLQTKEFEKGESGLFLTLVKAMGWPPFWRSGMEGVIVIPDLVHIIVAAGFKSR